MSRSKGVTVYRAIKHSGAKLGDWIVLPGAGGGLGHLAVQYARAAGLRVLAIGMASNLKWRLVIVFDFASTRHWQG